MARTGIEFVIEYETFALVFRRLGIADWNWLWGSDEA
jgi:hypothetical protein